MLAAAAGATHPAAAAGLDVTWNDCVGGPAESSTIAFACDGGVDQTYPLVFQFRSPVDVPRFVRLTAFVDYQSAAAAPLQPFWRYESGGCNHPAPGEAGVVIEDDRSALGGCAGLADPWGGDGSAGLEAIASYGPDYDRPGNGHWILVVSRFDAVALARDAATYAFHLRFDNRRRATCAGCGEPGVVVWNLLRLESDDLSAPIEISGADLRSDCARLNGASASLCGLTPAASRTWGQIKALYRR